MLDKQLVALLNQQVNMEWYSAYLYLDIHDYYVDKELNGFGTWFYIQTQEERDHAMLFIKYLQNNSERLKLSDVKAAAPVFNSFRDPAIAAYEHEQKVTASINAIYAVAYEKKDFRTMQFLDWFVKEQNEEEKNTETIIKKYDLFGSDPKGLYMLDQELGARVYTPPTLVL
ncbi:ferritin [Sporobacter termitidis DSM 10068]|uniref:Ferritin n=1 Tax=Sporobacter termitidis DSM 10068 TaxID=1123282 RepID=A0A1M5Z247_9FIRM|nr:ferritin [Sporobacter termitidis]SHI18289.1 ferritin [Sporobacter termitidis DSM 10068]